MDTEFDLPFCDEVDYRALLARARRRYETFSLVWRAGMRFNKQAEHVRRALEPFLVKTYRRRTWPGTQSSGEASQIGQYRVCEGSLAILGRFPDVWSWQAPNLPEDLAFYRGQAVCFASVAHERMAWEEPA